MLQLRPRQVECLDAILANYLESIHQQLVVKATGTGKAVIIANIQRKMRHLLPGKVLVFVHTEQLVKQLVKTCTEWNPELKVGREQAEHYAATDCDIIVSCVASIGREGATRLQRFGGFDIIVCDEAHHSIAQTYLNVFEDTGVLKPESKKLLVGFTATPKRKNLTRAQKKAITVLDDEELLSLKSVYKKIVYTYTIRKAIKEGWLVPLLGYKLKTETDLSNIKTTAGDYAQDELSETVNTPSRNLQIVKTWIDKAERRPTVAFTVDIKHAQSLAADFRKYGVKAEAIWGVDPEQESKIKRFEAGEIEVLCNCSLLIEGFDAWIVMCVLMSAPTKSSSKFTQEIGRGTRLEEGTGNLLEALKAGIPLRKKDCLVIDVVDNNKRCSLVTLPSLVGLSPDFDLKGESVTAAIDKVEELQEKYPGVDFTKLEDLSKVQTYVESLDLFTDPYPEEVKNISSLVWMLQQDGYVLRIPEDRELAAEVKRSGQYWMLLNEKFTITQNELEQWDVTFESTKLASPMLKGTYTTLQDAVKATDDAVRRCRASRLVVLEREAPWKSNNASDASKKYLKRTVGKRPFIYCVCPTGEKCSGVAGTLCENCKKQQLTAGESALAITRFKNK